MKKRVIDASSLLLLIKGHGGKALETLKASSTIPLINYEIGNAIRTSTAINNHINPAEAEITLEKIHTGLELMEIQRQETLKDSKKILETSLNYNLTYYGSAYLTAADDAGAILVTDDEHLADAARKVNTTVLNANQLAIG
ncbi:MAG: type II toxin-antitoxin system VapC family toxin [Candidatus Bathyarchaeia archaeon]